MNSISEIAKKKTEEHISNYIKMLDDDIKKYNNYLKKKSLYINSIKKKLSEIDSNKKINTSKSTLKEKSQKKIYEDLLKKAKYDLNTNNIIFQKKISDKKDFDITYRKENEKILMGIWQEHLTDLNKNGYNITNL